MNKTETMEKYDILEYLESGYSGDVWLVKSKGNTDLFAVKFIKRGPKVTEHVAREIMIHKLLCHPNVIQFKEVVLTSSRLGIVMEYAEGGDLHDKVLNSAKKRLMAIQARSFFQQLVSGICYCHSVGVCHRDVKPGNILLAGRNHQHLKICDFGYSKSSRLHSKPKSVVGTPECRAPEVGSGEYNGKLADVWSLGVTLYYMLVGTYPQMTRNEHPEDPMITGETNNEKNACPFYIPKFLSTGSKDILTRMLVENPEERITIEEIMEHPWYNKNLPKNLPGETQVMEEYPRISPQLDDEIVNIVKEAQSSLPKDANGIKDVESGEEEDVKSGEEEEDENY